MVEEGSFLRITYTGRIKETGELFDTTDEELAKEEDAYNPNVNYGPVPVIVGGERIIEGLDDALEEMDVGAKETVSIPPEKAFGERDSDLVKLIPEQDFEDQGINPQPGMNVTLDQLRGKVLSVNSGRVRVDFNHPLAGKELEYEVEVQEQIGDRQEQAESICEFYLGYEVDVELDDEEAEIEIDEDVPQQTREAITEDMEKWMDIEKVKFSQVVEAEGEELTNQD